MTLSDRIIAAGPGEAREVLWALWRALNPQPNGDLSDWMHRQDRFARMLDARAYLSAAEMLVPEGWGYQVKSLPRRAPTAWQALAAAIAKTGEAP